MRFALNVLLNLWLCRHRSWEFATAQWPYRRNWFDTRYRIDDAPDWKLIETHCRRLASMIVWVVQRGVNLPLVILKIVNELPVPEFHSAVLDRINLDNIEAWRLIKQQIAQAKGAIAGM